MRGGGVSKAAEARAAVDVDYKAPVMDLDFGTADQTGSYTEDTNFNFTLTSGAQIVSNPDDATDKVLETVDNGTSGWMETSAKIFSDKSFSDGVTINMRMRPKVQNNMWNYIFSIGQVGNPWNYIDATAGFYVRRGDPYKAYACFDNTMAWDGDNKEFFFKDENNCNKWYTYTLTCDTNEVCVYLDGVRVAHATVAGDSEKTDLGNILGKLSQNCDFSLGSGASRGGFEKFPAYFDDVQVFNYSLNPAEVAYRTALSEAKDYVSNKYKQNAARDAIQATITTAEGQISEGSTVADTLLNEQAAALNKAVNDNKASLELATFKITMTADEDKYSYEYVNPTSNFDAVEYGSDAKFKVKPVDGYTIDGVYLDDSTMADATKKIEAVDGVYTIKGVTGTHTVYVKTTAESYGIHMITDGGAPVDSTWTKDDPAFDKTTGKVSLTAPTAGQLGYFLDEDDRNPDHAFTDFKASDYMTDDGITVYIYNSYTIASDAGADTGLTGGTFTKPDETVKHYLGETIEIPANPDAGKAPSITAKDASNNLITTKAVVKNDGSQAVTFEMPASNVTISKYEFVGLDKTVLDAAITTAQSTYDTNNEPTDANAAKGLDAKYTEETWNAFKTAFEKAKQVSEANDSDNTQGAINAAAEALTEAKGALKSKCLVTFDKTSLKVEKGSTATITPTVVTDGTGALTWTSSNEDVATVADASGNGTVTGVALGTDGNNTVTITATAEDGTTATCEATVIVKVTGITLANTDVVLGAKLTLVPTITPADATELDIKWTSSDPSTVRVDENGVLKGMSAGGPVTITAEVNGQSATCEVNVISSLATLTTSPKMNVTEEGVYLRFKSTLMKEEPADNWDTPRLRVYTDSACTDAGRYTYRADNFIEVPVGRPAVTTVDRGIDWSQGLTWEAWRAANRAGMEYYVSARKAGNSLVLTYTAGAISSTATVPVNEEDGPFYVDLDSCQCNLTDIRAVDSIYFSDPGPEKPVKPVNPDSVVTPKPIVTPGPAIDVPVNVGDIKTDKTVSGGNGDDWWASPAYSDNYPMSGKDSATEVYIGVDKLNAAGQGAFCIDIFSGDKYLSVASHNNAWTNGATVSNPDEIAGPMDVVLEEGHVYKVTVTRKGNDITVKVYDATAQKDMFEITAKDVNLPNDINVRVVANLGTLDVGQQVDVDPSATAKPDETAGPDESAAPSQKPDETAGPAETTAPTAEPSAEPSKEPEPSTEPTKGPEETTAPSEEPTAEPDHKGAEVGDKVTVSGTKYEVTAGSQVAYQAEKKTKASVTIPATVKVNGKTYKVTSVKANAFKNNKKVKNITVGKNITKIGKNAFKGCKKLKKIVIKSKKLKASGISKAAFKGVTKKTTVIVPKGKVKAYKKMFRKKGLAKNVKVKAAK